MVTATGRSACAQAPKVASYLWVHGWWQEAELNGKGSVWLLGDGEGRDDTEVTVPLWRDLGDFNLRMSEVLRALRQGENRLEAEIPQDLLTMSSDRIRLRAPSREADSGSLPLESAVAFVEQSGNLMLAAACAGQPAGDLSDAQAEPRHRLSQPGTDGADRAQQLCAHHPLAGRPGAGVAERAAVRRRAAGAV